MCIRDSVAYDPEVVQRNIGELQPARHVACGEDTGSRRAQVCVDPDGTPVVGFDPGGLEVQPCGGGAASRGEQHGIETDVYKRQGLYRIFCR